MTGKLAVPRDTISVRFVQEALAVAQARAIDVRPWLAEAGIPSALLSKPGTRVSARQYSDLWHVVARNLDDEFFGLDSHPMHYGSFKLMSFAVFRAPNLERAMRRSLQFLGVVLDDTRGELVRDGEVAHIILDSPRATPGIFAHATFLVLLRGLWCWLVNRRLPILTTEFVQPAPDYAQEYRLLFGHNTRFDCQRTVMSFPTESLALPIRRGEEELRNFLRHAPANFVVRYRDPKSLSGRVRARLRNTAPPDWPSFEQLAAELDIGCSTLRRRLEQEGSGYKAIKDSLRRDLAVDYLCHSELSIFDIAVELGFAEASAFHRAFQKWTGSSPGAYRR